jgi:hypothetical protein
MQGKRQRREKEKGREGSLFLLGGMNTFDGSEGVQIWREEQVLRCGGSQWAVVYL